MTDAALPDLSGPAADADRLVALAHGAMDWDVWGGARRVRYWDALAENVRGCCYAGPTLGDWWEAMTRKMGVGWPRSDDDRAALARLLSVTPPDARQVLDVLRGRAEMLVLRQRVRSDVARQARQDNDRQEGML